MIFNKLLKNNKSSQPLTFILDTGENYQANIKLTGFISDARIACHLGLYYDISSDNPLLKFAILLPDQEGVLFDITSCIENHSDNYIDSMYILNGQLLNEFLWLYFDGGIDAFMTSNLFFTILALNYDSSYSNIYDWVQAFGNPKVDIGLTHLPSDSYLRSDCVGGYIKDLLLNSSYDRIYRNLVGYYPFLFLFNDLLESCLTYDLYIDTLTMNENSIAYFLYNIGSSTANGCDFVSNIILDAFVEEDDPKVDCTGIFMASKLNYSDVHFDMLYQHNFSLAYSESQITSYCDNIPSQYISDFYGGFSGCTLLTNFTMTINESVGLNLTELLAFNMILCEVNFHCANFSMIEKVSIENLCGLTTTITYFNIFGEYPDVILWNYRSLGLNNTEGVLWGYPAYLNLQFAPSTVTEDELTNYCNKLGFTLTIGEI